MVQDIILIVPLGLLLVAVLAAEARKRLTEAPVQALQIKGIMEVVTETKVEVEVVLALRAQVLLAERV